MEVIQIDATVIIGVLILLSLVNLVVTEAKITESVLPPYFFKSIYLVTYVVAIFSISAMIEIGIIANWWRKQNTRTHDQIMKGFPNRASPAGLFTMMIGFAWLTVSIMVYAAVDFFNL